MLVELDVPPATLAAIENALPRARCGSVAQYIVCVGSAAHSGDTHPGAVLGSAAPVRIQMDAKTQENLETVARFRKLPLHAHLLSAVEEELALQRTVGPAQGAGAGKEEEEGAGDSLAVTAVVSTVAEAQEEPTAELQEEAAAKKLATQREMAYSIAYRDRTWAAKTTEELDLLVKLATDEVVEVVRAVASNKHCPVGILDTLATHRDPLVKHWVARHKNCSEVALYNFADSNDVTLAQWVASNAKCPVEALDMIFANHSDTTVRCAIARNPQCSDAIRATLLKDQEVKVRIAVLGAPKCPKHLIEEHAVVEDNQRVLKALSKRQLDEPLRAYVAQRLGGASHTP